MMQSELFPWQTPQESSVASDPRTLSQPTFWRPHEVIIIRERKDDTCDNITNHVTKSSSHSSRTSFQHGVVNKWVIDPGMYTYLFLVMCYLSCVVFLPRYGSESWRTVLEYISDQCWLGKLAVSVFTQALLITGTCCHCTETLPSVIYRA